MNEKNVRFDINSNIAFGYKIGMQNQKKTLGLWRQIRVFVVCCPR